MQKKLYETKLHESCRVNEHRTLQVFTLADSYYKQNVIFAVRSRRGVCKMKRSF